MKTKSFVLLFFLALFSVFTATAAVVIIQDESPFTNAFGSIASLLVAIPIVTEFVKTKVGLQGLGVQIFSWSLGLILAFAGYFLNLGMFADASVLYTALVGVGLALVSNGIADTGLVEWLLSFVTKSKT